MAKRPTPNPEPVVEDRRAVAWMNYPGRVEIDPNRRMGPTYNGEFLFAVEALYVEAEGKTVVGFSYVPPPVVAA